MVRPDRIGDVVLVTPLLRALRKHYPHGFIGALVRPYAADVLRNNPYINDVLLDDPAGEDAGLASFARQVRCLRRQHFDIALMPLPSSRHAWMCFLAGIPRRLATSRKLYNRLTLTRCIRRHTANGLRHEADYCLDLARHLGVADDGLHTDMFLLEEEVARAEQLLGSGTFVGIHPSSGHSAPNWPVSRYAELAEDILQMSEGIRLVLTGGPGDVSLATAFESLPKARVVNLLGSRSMRETAAVLSQLSVLVSASTGPMHMAAALRVPTVSMFCPLPACSPALWGPLGNQAEIVLPAEGYCQLRCPGDPRACEFTGGIAVPTVSERVRQVLVQHSSPSTS